MELFSILAFTFHLVANGKNSVSRFIHFTESHTLNGPLRSIVCSTYEVSSTSQVTGVSAMTVWVPPGPGIRVGGEQRNECSVMLANDAFVSSSYFTLADTKHSISYLSFLSANSFPPSGLQKTRSNVHPQCWQQHKTTFVPSIQIFCLEDTEQEVWRSTSQGPEPR